MEINSKNSNQNGFSLVELIVVVGLTAILAITITAISMSSLLSSSRVRNLVKVKQTGDYALTQMQQLIRNAKTIVECSDTGTTDDYIIITGQDGGVSTIQTELIATNEYKIASVSGGISRYYNSEEIPANSFDLTCTPTSTNPDLVKVTFTLSNNTQSSRVYDKSTVDFETSIEIRNQ